MLDSMKQLLDVIGKIPTAGAQAAHIDFLREKYQAAAKDVENLQAENSRLKQQLHAMEQEKSRHAVAIKHTKHRGALFERKSGGGHFEQPICPKCHCAMTSFESMFNMYCSDPACGIEANFKPDELPEVLAQLEDL